jgi:hypothetical protein
MRCRHIPEALSSMSPVEPQISPYRPVACVLREVNIGLVTTFAVVIEIPYVSQKKCSFCYTMCRCQISSVQLYWCTQNFPLKWLLKPATLWWSEVLLLYKTSFGTELRDHHGVNDIFVMYIVINDTKLLPIITYYDISSSKSPRGNSFGISCLISDFRHEVMRTELFWAITQRVVLIPYRRSGTLAVLKRRQRRGVFIGCGEGVCVGARSRMCRQWVHSLGIFMGVIHTLFLAMSRLGIVILCYINNL